MASINQVIPILAYNNIMDGNNPRGLGPAPLTDSHYWVVGHSGFTYSGGDSAPATFWTTTGYWLGWLATESGNSSGGCGDFGQIPDFNSAWISRPGAPDDFDYDYVTNTYDPFPFGETFGEQDWQQVYFMPSNFEQATETPSFKYTGAATTMFDNIQSTGVNPTYYMYSFVPEPTIVGIPGGPVDAADLTPSEAATFYSYCLGGYLTWHMDWFDEIETDRPLMPMKYIPLPQIIADIVQNEPYMSTLVWTDLYADTAPHGTEGLYLLQAMICYRAVYRQNPTLGSSTLPAGATTVPTEISNNLTSLVSYIDQRLNYYNTNGRTAGRVF